MAHYLELAQGSRRRGNPSGAPCGERLGETVFIEWLNAHGCSELGSSQFVRLSQELDEGFPAGRGRIVQRLKDLCLLANSSEEFFLSASKGQWLRTVIKCNADLFSTEAVYANHISSITIHSIVVPCHPYWPKLLAVRGRAAREMPSKRLYFPSTFLEDPISNQKSLAEMWNEWDESEEQSAILNHLHGRDDDDGMRTSSPPLWNIDPNEVDVDQNLSSPLEGGQVVVQRVSWRGGNFVRKNFNDKKTFYTEFEVVLRVSHPHVVYSFGVSSPADEDQHSLLMELHDYDLLLLIEDRVRFNGPRDGHSQPPFSPLQSIDILLQISKAMTHIHGLDDPVIHGDLKPGNILVSQCEILGDVRQYLVKVADFGSARILIQNSSSTFKPGPATTKYAAPEVLKARGQKNPDIKFPKKIDVYSFGVVAFQILTGVQPYERFLPNQEVPNSLSVLTEGIVAGNLRPCLREACERPNFWNDEDLMALVESCWHHEPSKRPEFSDVTDELERIRSNLDQSPVNGVHILPPAQTNAVDDGPQDAADVLPPAQEITVNGGPQNPRIEASAFAPPEANAINGTPQDGVDVLPPTHEITVNGGPQNQNIGTHAYPWPRENATATTVDGAPEVCGKKKPKRGRKFPFAKMLSCARISPRNVIE